MDVLIVDDDHTNLSLFTHLLKVLPEVQSSALADPLQALDWCKTRKPDLVLVDYMMPVLDGLGFLERLRAMFPDDPVPVIMITADVQSDVRHRALQLGANDFLTKPVDNVEFRARVRNLLALRQAQLQLRERADWLGAAVAQATREIVAGEREAIHRLSRMAEYRDPETGAHLLRMAHYARLLAARLGLDEREQELIFMAAPMHDIGKVAIPDMILLKPGRLTPAEMEVMRTHAQIGADILHGSASPLLRAAADIALHHHEHYDGGGYPAGLRGEQISLYGRIIAVADVFDALTSARPYKPAWEFGRAVALLREGAGSHFDPVCVDAFLGDTEALLRIHTSYRDQDES